MQPALDEEQGVADRQDQALKVLRLGSGKDQPHAAPMLGHLAKEPPDQLDVVRGIEEHPPPPVLTQAIVGDSEMMPCRRERSIRAGTGIEIETLGPSESFKNIGGRQPDVGACWAD